MSSSIHSILGGGIADFTGRRIPPPENLPPRIVKLDDRGWFRVFGLPEGPRTVWKLENARALLAKIEAQLAAKTATPATTSEPTRNPVEEASAIAAKWFVVSKKLQAELAESRAEVAALREAGHITKERLDAMRATERQVAIQSFRDSIDPKSLRPGLTPDHLEVCADCGLVSDAIEIVRGSKLCLYCAKGGR